MPNYCDDCACSPPKGFFTCLKGYDLLPGSHWSPQVKNMVIHLARLDKRDCPDFVSMVKTRFERILKDD